MTWIHTHTHAPPSKSQPKITPVTRQQQILLPTLSHLFVSLSCYTFTPFRILLFGQEGGRRMAPITETERQKLLLQQEIAKLSGTYNLHSLFTHQPIPLTKSQEPSLAMGYHPNLLLLPTHLNAITLIPVASPPITYPEAEVEAEEGDEGGHTDSIFGKPTKQLQLRTAPVHHRLLVECRLQSQLQLQCRKSQRRRMENCHLSEIVRPGWTKGKAKRISRCRRSRRRKDG